MFFFRKRPPQPILKRRWRWSLRSSFWLHSIIVSTVIMECLMLVQLPMPEEAAPQQVVLHAPPLAEPQPQPTEINAFIPAEENWLAKDSVDISHLEAAQADPRWELLRENKLDEKSSDEQEVASSFLSRQVMRSIEQSDAVSDQDNLERLKQLANQQSGISTAESIAEINSLVSKVLGTGPRASEPAKEPVAGDFDFDTGQLHDMTREMLEDGTFKYIAVLVDSAGRKLETEMTATEGESAYKTFELIKQNPLLERVYRGVMMSLLDKMLKPTP